MDIGNIKINRRLPRFSTRYLKEMFEDKEIVGAEIGVYQGENSISLLKELNIRTFYLIDPYISCGTTDDPLDDTELLDKAKIISEKRLYKYESQIKRIYEFSEVGIPKIPEKLDFIYIDGNHTYDGVKIDLELSWKKLKEDGILCGHDFIIVDVARAVIEFADKYKLKIETHYCGDWILSK